MLRTGPHVHREELAAAPAPRAEASGEGRERADGQILAAVLGCVSGAFTGSAGLALYAIGQLLSGTTQPETLLPPQPIAVLATSGLIGAAIGWWAGERTNDPDRN